MTSETPAVSSGDRFYGVDGLRGLLVLHVLLHHFMLRYQGLLPVDSLFGRISKLGFLSPRFFFVVSGLLIFHQFLTRVQFKARPKSYFFLNRFFRIFPLWWMAVLVYFLLGFATFRESIVYASFMFGFAGFYIFSIPHAWSIFAEEFFYLIFPWMFRFVKSSLIPILLFFVFYAVSYFWRQHAAELGVPSKNWFIDFFPLANLHYFFLGIAAYHFVKSEAWGRLQHSSSALKFAGLEASAYGVMLGFCFFFGARFPEAIMFPILVLTTSERSLTGRVCSLRIFREIGRACYPSYLFHFLLIYAFLGQTYRWTVAQRDWPLTQLLIFEFLILAALLAILGIGIHKLIETPLLKRAKAYLEHGEFRARRSGEENRG